MLEGQFQVVEHRQPAGGRSRPFLVAAPLPGPWRIVCGSCPVPLRFAASYLRARRYVIGLPQEGRPRGLLFAAPRRRRLLVALLFVRLLFGHGDHPFDLPTTWLGTDLAVQPPEGDRERVAAGTQRLGLVILGPILAAGRRAAWTDGRASGHRRAGSGSPGSGLRVRRRWRRTRPTAGAGVCGRSTRRWLPQWREAITLSVCRSNSTSRIDPFTRRWRGARRAGRVVAGEPNRARR
jgi:hypothetical protein